MADLNELNSAGMTKVIGSDANGQETTPVKSTPTGDMHVSPRDENGNAHNLDNPVPVVHVGAAGDKDWDQLILARDPVTQDIVSATYKKAGNTVRVLTMGYDANENLETVDKS